MKRPPRWVFALLFLLCLPVSSAWAKKEEMPKAPKFSSGIWVPRAPNFKKLYRDKITLIYFWDYTSINCLREISVLKTWHAAYHPYGFDIIWVHVPEFSFAKRKRNVERAVERLQIEQPVYLDNDFEMWEAFENRSWPTKYLIDPEGRIRHTRVGEGRHQEMETEIRDALQGLNPQIVLPEPVFKEERELFDPDLCGLMTGETYMGHRRAGWWGGKIANRKWMAPDEVLLFNDRGERVEKGFFAHGLWQNREDDFRHARGTSDLSDYLGLLYVAREVYVVASQSASKEFSRVYVTRDGVAIPEEMRGLDLREDEVGTYFMIQEPRLYYLIENENQDVHELRLWTPQENVAINSFSFSNLCLSEL